ncbi:MAG: hypothetical protein KUG74_05780 [Rhodobacteraceae bacterium]|nr:hypothetical protein [Paracoccaceae bacterium]
MLPFPLGLMQVWISMSIVKTILIAIIVSVSLCSSARADEASVFRTLVESSKVQLVEKLLAQLDREVAASGYRENNRLRQLFGMFSTTHPDYIDFIDKWQQGFPDSIYQKVAQGWQLEHLAWAVRGSKTIDETSPEAMQQMHEFLQESSMLAWDVFNQRNDFIPAADLVAQLYLNGYGEISLEDFTEIALKANPSLGLLEKIVLAHNPKWGGSFSEIKSVCEKYVPLVLPLEGYTDETCRVVAVYDSANIYRGGDKPVLKWAQDIMDKTPENLLYTARINDAIYFRRERPQSLEYILEHFNPYTAKAPSQAHNINYYYRSQKFIDKYWLKVSTAKLQRFMLDPLNPDFLEKNRPKAIRNKDIWKDPQAKKIYGEYLRKWLVYGRYRPEVWAFLARFSKRDADDIVVSDEAIENYIMAIQMSNNGWLHTLKLFKKLDSFWEYMSILNQSSNPAHHGEPIDPQAHMDRVACSLVESARLIAALCPSKGWHGAYECNEWEVTASRKKIEMAKTEKLCPAKLFIPANKLFKSQKSKL